jgi:hypothetical protein
MATVPLQMKAVVLLALVAVVLTTLAVADARRTGLAGGHSVDWSKVDTKLMDAKFGKLKFNTDHAKRSAAPSNSSLWEVIPGRYASSP